jgi:hypothetical protein
VTFQELVDELRKAAERSSADAPIYGINVETYRMWKANAGNAKSRRRWRRRGMVNTQRGPSCRMCAAMRSDPTSGRMHCAEHVADAVRAWNRESVR